MANIDEANAKLDDDQEGRRTASVEKCVVTTAAVNNLERLSKGK